MLKKLRKQSDFIIIQIVPIDSQRGNYVSNPTTQKYITKALLRGVRVCGTYF